MDFTLWFLNLRIPALLTIMSIKQINLLFFYNFFLKKLWINITWFIIVKHNCYFQINELKLLTRNERETMLKKKSVAASDAKACNPDIVFQNQPANWALPMSTRWRHCQQLTHCSWWLAIGPPDMKCYWVLLAHLSARQWLTRDYIW